MNYNDNRWKHKRELILKRDGYTCRYCKRYGRMRAAQTVHHIYPVEFYPEYGYCNWNLISLCNDCHNKMHKRDSHELTAEGMALQRKVLDQKEKFDNLLSPPH